MKVVGVTGGKKRYPSFEINGMVLDFENGALVLDFSAEQVSEDKVFYVIGDGQKNLKAQSAVCGEAWLVKIRIPGRKFLIRETGISDGMGFRQIEKILQPLDMDEVILIYPEAEDGSSEGSGNNIQGTAGRNGGQAVPDAWLGAKFALEAATNGKNTLLFDDTGMPSVMVRIPCFRWCDVMEGGSEEICSAFIADGKVYDSIYISKYLNCIRNDRAYSLPGEDPANIIKLDEARAVCAAKGPGWHLMTNAEWVAVAMWSIKNGTAPHGNTNAGNDALARFEHGVRTYGLPLAGSCRGDHQKADYENPGDYPGNPPVGRTRTGISPASWSHDGTDAGIFDLVGNVWDLIAGFRVMNGEIQVIPDNNSALNVDESPDSTLWRAVSADGELVMPGTPGTLKFDGTSPGSDEESLCLVDSGIRINTEVEFPQYTGAAPKETAECGWSAMPMEMLSCTDSVRAHRALAELGILPPKDLAGGGMLFLRSYGERVPSRGASWYDGDLASLWSLYLRDNREYCFPDIGFRACWLPV